MWDFDESQARASAHENYDGVQSRVLDSLHFKLQQAINIKDDEIERLEEEIAYLKGEVESYDFDKSRKTQITSEKIQNLKRKIFKAQQKSAVLISQSKTKFAEELNSIQSSHNEHVKMLHKEIENQILGVNHAVEIKKADEVDLFLESLNSSKYKLRNKERPIEVNQPIVNETFIEFQKAEGKLNIARKQVEDLQGQINSVKADLALLEREQKNNDYKPTKKAVERKKFDNSYSYKSDYSLSPMEENSTDSEEEMDYEEDSTDFDNDSDDISMDENIIKQKNEFEEQVKEMKARHEREVKELKEKIEEQENFISSAAKIEEDSENSSVGKDRVVRMERTKKLSRELSRMSDKQKETKRKSLISENKALKREIGRLDFMIYGKAGRYNKWRLIK